MSSLYFFSFIMAGVGAVVVTALWAMISRINVSNAKAEKIADAIANGAMSFLKEEYKIIMIVIALIAGAIFYGAGQTAALLFVAGALFSLIPGYIGMRAATKANVRTTIAAQRDGEYGAFIVAFFGGGIMGFSVASFGLFGVAALMYTYYGHPDLALYLTTFGLGASVVAFFARVGGGIYTKSADVGADLVGKIEAGIPEDDPRNPAVIADNVGDCVGDTAGMGADIYESYVGTMLSSIILSLSLYPNQMSYATLPFALSALGLVSSCVGLFSNLILRFSSAAMLRNATYVAIVTFLGSTYWYLGYAELPACLFICAVVGCVTGIFTGLVAEYYTGGNPVKRLAENCQTGAATNIIYGLSLGMESVAFPVIFLCIAVLVSYTYGGAGLFGVSIAAVSMLATVGITMTVDGYGPIADNAGGIAEMAGFGKEIRTITDKLDALGNTTAAIGKGFAIGSALMTALVMFAAYAQKANLTSLDVLNPWVMVGVFLGGIVPFIVSALTMRSVGKAALAMVYEVRNQFRTIPGLMEGKADPDYARCVAISTQASLHEMILPGVITILLPVLVWYFCGVETLGGVLVGSTVTGVMMALFLSNVGGAWDNAKKYIEAGNLGGKGSESHKAAVIGDTVGDPCKDTSGPALNILIKLISVVALLLVSLK